MPLIKNDDGTTNCSKCGSVYIDYVNFGDILEKIAIGERCDVCTTLLWNWRTKEEMDDLNL